MSTLELWLLTWGAFTTATSLLLAAKYAALRDAVIKAGHEEILRSGSSE